MALELAVRATGWGLALLLATAVFIVAFRALGDARRAFSIALAWLKIEILVLAVIGLDVPLWQVTVYRAGEPAASVTVTAARLLILNLLLLNLLTLAWPRIQRELRTQAELPLAPW